MAGKNSVGLVSVDSACICGEFISVIEAVYSLYRSDYLKMQFLKSPNCPHKIAMARFFG